MNNIQVVAHTSFLGKTGYNAHSQAFFTHLNKIIPTRVRNYSYTDDLSFMTKEQMDMIIQQKWNDPPHQIGKPFIQDPSNLQVDIILNESHHYFFYDQYDSPMIAYNVWESTKQLPEFFNRILEYDQFWCPTEWQRQCTIDQGYPADRVKVVPEGVNGNIFRTSDNKTEKEALFRKYNIPNNAFVFMIFGRWDYRKSTTEMIESWVNTFKNEDNCYLIISADNPFSSDGMETTEQRLKYYNLEHERIRVLHFPPRDEYIKWLQHGSCLLSVSRSEGWNLPLMEAIACGTPTICSDWGGHLEFADGISHKVQVLNEEPPKQVFMLGDNHDLGVWGEPDFDHMGYVMKNHVYKNPDAKPRAMAMSKYIRELYTWDNAARKAKEIIEELVSYRKHYSLVKNIHGMELYQDQYINGQVVVEGKRDCKSRYEAMKPVFEKYNRPFTILDIGANFGYYSIRASTDYGATSIMVENKANEIEVLKSLCEHNNCGDKLSIINTTLDLHKLEELGKCEHFDVVLALNVLHHFKEDEIIDACYAVTKLGDNVILETPPVNDGGACGQKNLSIIYDFFDCKEKVKLGEFKRHTSNTNSELVWLETPRIDLKWPYYEYEKLFTRTDLDVERLKDRGINLITSDFNSKTISSSRRSYVRDWIPGINLKTFIELNGVYPDKDDIIDKLKNRNIITEYKWDNSNNDLTTHNFILSGRRLHLIDFDDGLIEEENVGDDRQIQKVINYIVDKSDEVDPNLIKLNLGCGNDIREGYINVDKYNNTGNVDYQWDLAEIDLPDNSVGEIFTSHVFEHIMINDVYKVLEEWYRVLAPGGKLIMNLPNLETEVKIWLAAPPEKKWFEVHRIFGSQSHEGNTHFNGHTPESLKWLLERFNFKVINAGVGNRGHGEEIQLHAIKEERKDITTTECITHFVDGPFAEVKGDSSDKGFYVFDFLDPDNNSSVHQQMMGINTWTRPYRKYYTNWDVQIRRNGKLIHRHKLDLKNKNVLIGIDSKSMGDSLAWMPYVKEFKDKHGCNVWVSTFWNKLFRNAEEYKDLTFIKPGQSVDNIYASYIVGCHDDDFNKNKRHWRTVPLQQVASDFLGLEYREIIPSVGIPLGERPIEKKYVAITQYSTFHSKFWNYPGGWQTIIDYIIDELGLEVMVISKEKTDLNRIIDMTGRPIEETINNIGHSEFFMGVSCGPTWLAWALKKPTILISGYSTEWAEFKTDCQRIINKNVCNGCFNDPTVPLERGDWQWCPRLKGTDRQFECTKRITPEMVIDAIKRINP